MHPTKKIVFLMLLLMSTGIYIIGCASTAPLPETYHIVTPSQDLPPEIAAYSGIWKGTFHWGQEHVLVVEYIDTEKASVIYSSGVAPGYEPRYWRVLASIVEGSAIKVDLRNGFFIYKIDENQNMIHGSFIDEHGVAKPQVNLYRAEIHD